MLVCSYFYTHATHLLGFDTIDMVLFDTKYFFVEATVCCLWAGLLRGFSILDCKFDPYGLLTQISLLNLGWALSHYGVVELDYEQIDDNPTIQLSREHTNTFTEFIETHQCIQDHKNHFQLQTDLIEHLWQLQGEL